MRQYLKALLVFRLFDHFHAQPRRRSGRRNRWPTIAAVSPEQLQAGRVSFGFGDDRRGPHGVLHTGRLDEYRER